MRNKTLEVLEFSRLKEILQGYAVSPCGKEALEKLVPQKTKEEAEEIFKHIRVIEKIASKGTRFDFSSFPAIKKALERASTGAPLNFKEIREIGEFIEAYTKLYESLCSSYDFLLSPEILRPLKNQIFSMVGEDGDVRSDATPELFKLRQKIASLRAEIYELLNRVVREYELEGILREPVITIRNGRFVIPVLPNFKTDGIVHGYSKSSETVYVEPMGVVAVQNSYIRVIEEEKEEIDRIRRELTERIEKLSTALFQIWELVSKIELYYILYLFKAEFNGVYPEFSDGIIEIVNGYHPILVKSVGYQGVIPLNISIDKRVFLVSGPNAGGKTVLLKTIGLFHLMAASGIPTPAEKAVLVFPMRVYAAGFQDEQDIMEGESSFTSYIKGIVYILREAIEGDLVLFDELISSTDPQEASGIAYAVLEELMSRGAWVMGNTHLSTLKLLVSRNPDMLSASMEFDPVELKPTYKVRIGEIGVSHAFEIAEKSGMAAEIIENAKRYVQGESALLEVTIKNLREKEHLYSLLVEEYNRKLESLEEKMRKAERIGRERALKIVDEAKKEVEKLLKELRREESKEKVKSLAKEAKKKLLDVEESYDLGLKPVNELVVNREYFIKPIGISGILKEVKKDKVLMQVGRTFIEVPQNYLYERG
ncbi:MAG TPA: hypothetical protein PKU94_01210 [Candidatus Hydrothermia bacterium]|nr:hypothetical protein [Candidatus Hydrothermia bacterium]HRD22414.1 hypothetical protein [Candidatus Hydrothermia bacterium]